MTDIEPRRIKKLPKTPRTLGEILGAEQLTAPTPRSITASGRRTREKLSPSLVAPRLVKGFVTLTQLAAERGIQAQLARIWVKQAGIKKPGERWVWEGDARDLARARKALGLKP